MDTMKISLLTPDVSHNCLGRAYVLAKILQRRHDVEIVGPMFGDGVWAPLAHIQDVPVKSYRIGGPLTSGQVLSLRKSIDGDVLYVSKTRFASFWVGVAAKLTQSVPLVVDIDDWERGFIMQDRSTRTTKGIFRRLSDFFYDSSVALAESLLGLADNITVSNTFLQRKFGGTIIWHARDTDTFRPDAFPRDDMRKLYGIRPDEKVVMFLGSPGPHKGLDELIEAMRRIQDREVSLCLVGIPDGTPEGARLRAAFTAALGGRFRGFGLQPFDRIPEFLAAADVVVIPQLRTAATVGQVPAKVFDAMAMAKPIVASAVSDLPYILRGCGFLVEPGSPDDLTRAIRAVLADPSAASEMGRKARERCIREFSWNTMEPILAGVFAPYA